MHSEEAKRVLGAASEPPVRCIGLGKDRFAQRWEGKRFCTAHDKTVCEPDQPLAVNISDTDDAAASGETLDRVCGYVLERVGETMLVDMFPSRTRRGESGRIRLAVRGRTLDSRRRPLLFAVRIRRRWLLPPGPWKGIAQRTCLRHRRTAGPLSEPPRQYGHVLAVTAPDLNALVFPCRPPEGKGDVNTICDLHFQAHSLAERFQTNTIAGGPH